MDRDQNYWKAIEFRLRYADDGPEVPPDDPISEAFRKEYSAEHYLKLRQGYPHLPISVSSRAGYPWLLRNQIRLEAVGIGYDLVRSAMDAEPDKISRLSLHVLELLLDRKNREKAGEVHLAGSGRAISDSLVSFLISIMLDALDDQEVDAIPRDLIVLIKHHMGAMSSVELRSHNVSEQRQFALDLGALCLKVGAPISMSKVAEILKVERSTVLRWFDGTEYRNEVKAWFEELENRFDGQWGPNCHDSKTTQF